MGAKTETTGERKERIAERNRRAAVLKRRAVIALPIALLGVGAVFLAFGAKALLESPSHHGNVALAWPYDCPNPRSIPSYPGEPLGCFAIRDALSLLGFGVSAVVLAVLLGSAGGRAIFGRLAPIIAVAGWGALFVSLTSVRWVIPLPWSYGWSFLVPLLVMPAGASLGPLARRLTCYIVESL